MRIGRHANSLEGSGDWVVDVTFTCDNEAPGIAAGPEIVSHPLLHLHYISCSLIAADTAQTTLESLVHQSRARNLSIGVTGSLLFAQNQFSQILEGPESAVSLVMASILQDHRHTDCVVIEECAIETRRFQGWSMAYSGASAFVAQSVTRALAGARSGSKRDIRRLLRLMLEFAAQPEHPAVASPRPM